MHDRSDIDDSTRLRLIEQAVREIDRKLFGNGQPGEIDKLHGRISAVNDRVNDLRIRVIGYGGGAIGLLSLGAVVVKLWRA